MKHSKTMSMFFWVCMFGSVAYSLLFPTDPMPHILVWGLGSLFLGFSYILEYLEDILKK